MACTTHCDVLVVGGGTSGLAAALTAAACGLSAVVADGSRGEERKRHGRAIALMASARDRLIDLDLWSAIAPVAWPIERVRVQDSIAGQEHLYQAPDSGRGVLFHGVEYAPLRARLDDRLREDDRVTRLRGRRVRSLYLDAGWRRAELDDGTVVRARLVIGADGRGSTVRETIGLTARRTEFAQTALAFIVEGDLIEATTVLERLTPEGPISVLPIGPERFAVAWVAATTTTQRRRGLGRRAFLQELATALDLSTIAEARLATPVHGYRLGLSHADRYVAPRLVLVGDAAHGSHPVHAQGLNMAVADVHELAMLWRVEGRRFASAEALARYQRNRRLANAARLGLTDVMNRLFQPSTAPFAFLQATDGGLPLERSAAGLHPAVDSEDEQLAG